MLHKLIKHATLLANPTLCQIGHDWQPIGGRQCPKGHNSCTQTVFECVACGLFDYGELGGPAEKECKNDCIYRHEL